MLGLAIVLLPFGVIGSLMAYAIYYEEMLHHYKDSKQASREAIQVAVFVLVFFILLSLGLAAFLPKAIG